MLNLFLHLFRDTWFRPPFLRTCLCSNCSDQLRFSYHSQMLYANNDTILNQKKCGNLLIAVYFGKGM